MQFEAGFVMLLEHFDDTETGHVLAKIRRKISKANLAGTRGSDVVNGSA